MSQRASAFVAKWKYESREHAESQTWWNDFFAIFGVDRYSTAVFERWARRASTGHQGRIDVFMPGVMIAEHKSLGKDGGRAESQAEDYLAGGEIPAAEMPRYIVSTDFAEVQITDLQSPADAPLRFPIAKLPRYISRFAFLSGYQAPVRAVADQAAVSIKAARQMGKLYEALLGDVDASAEGHDAEQAAIFMTRLLFLMYGDDADGLWDPDAFLSFIENCTVEDGSDTGAQIAVLFQILDTPLDKRSHRLDDHLKVFPYVNGGLFCERIDIPTFDRSMREALLKALRFEWSAVSPAIFGSLFQGMSTRAERREQGEHYTSEINILKVLRPLFLDEMEEKLQSAWPSVPALITLHESFATMRYLDPACGSGNFLIVAYREMRDLELRLLLRLRELRGVVDYALDGTWDLKVAPDQFAGIEINWWPAKIAETAMFLVDHQANQRMALSLGSAPERLPITVAANILHRNALRVDWNEAIEANSTTFVFGNPPFVGQKEKVAEQTADMRLVWGADYNGYLDFVTGWHAKTLAYLRTTPGAAFAFVTTNSVTQGQPVGPLFRPIIREGWRISFAHRTFEWESEATGAAAVHCVVIGFDKSSRRPRLFDYDTVKSTPHEIEVTRINGYLLDGPDVFVDKRSKPVSSSLPPVQVGSKASDWGYLTVTPDQYAEAAADPAAFKYLRPFIGGEELINSLDRWCFWLENLDPEDLKASHLLQDRLKHVQEMRLSSDKAVTRKLAETPALFAERRQPSADYLGIPNTFSESRRYMTVARLPATTIAAVKLFTAPDPEGFLFAVISSTMALVWQKMVGGRLKSDPSFSNTVVWNNFPLPEVSVSDRERVIAGGQAVLEARNLQVGKSLADMYNPLGMSPEMVKAHDGLDKAVDRLFGFAKPPTQSQREQRLFERYVEVVKSGQLALEPAKPRRSKGVSGA